MPDDRLRELFDHAAEEPVDVPPVERVLASGQQRRRRARLQASTIAWTIMLAAGFGAPQVPASLATKSPHSPRIVSVDRSSPGVLSERACRKLWNSQRTAQPDSDSPRRTRPDRRRGPRDPAPRASTRAAALPPPGNGQLILGAG